MSYKFLFEKFFKVTPVDYEPPGFKPCDFDNYVYQEGRVKIDGGKVHSVWHQLTLNVNVAQTMLKQVDDFQTIDETFDSNSVMVSETPVEADKNAKLTNSSQEISEPSSKVKNMKHKLVDKTCETADIEISDESEQENVKQKESIDNAIDKIQKLNFENTIDTSQSWPFKFT